jgi:hypothetical protein
VEEQAAVLQQAIRMTALSAAKDFVVSDDNIHRCSPLEA